MCIMWRQLPKWYTVHYTYDIYEIQPTTLSCVALNAVPLRVESLNAHASHITRCSTRLYQISYRVAFYEEIWLRAQTSCNLSPECLEFPRSRIYFSPDACALDLWASGQLQGFVSDGLVNLAHQSRFSWFLDCSKYRVDVFIRVPFYPQKGTIKATNH